MTIHCQAKPCPIVLSAQCVYYEGANLVYSGIQTNDTIEEAFIKLDQLIHNSGMIETDPVFSAWNRRDGITITESQIINLQNYLINIIGQDLSTADNSVSQFVKSLEIRIIKTLTKAEYIALNPKVSTTMYLILKEV